MADTEDEIKFKRYLYFLSENHHYVVKKKEDIFDKTIDSLLNLVAQEKFKKVIEIIEQAIKFDWLPNRNLVLHVLALCTHFTDNAELKTAAYKCASNFIRNAEELFQYIKYERALQVNASRGLRRVINDWYIKQELPRLLSEVTLIRSHHGWTHRDALKVAHVKASDTERRVLLAYACRGLDHARKEAKEEKGLDKTFEKLEAADHWRRCSDEQKALELIKNKGTGESNEAPGPLIRSAPIWAALVPNMPLEQLASNLGRFHRLGMFRTGQPALEAVVERFGNVEAAKASGLKPADVLVRMKTFERPRPPDVHLRAAQAKKEDSEHPPNDDAKPVQYSRSHAVTAALGKLLHSTMRNVKATGRRYVIAVELRPKDALLRSCFGCQPVRYAEAAALLVLQLARAERDVQVLWFNGADVTPVQLANPKGVTLNQLMQRMREAAETSKPGALPARPVRWALDNNRHVDVFVNVLVTGDSPGRVPRAERRADDADLVRTLSRYRNRLRQPRSRVFNVALCGRSMQHFPAVPGLLNVAGYSAGVPALLQAFAAAPFF